ncbi:nucleotide sugar dehydrogenase [Clostridium sp. OS1-26]|uniref:UDP-glucose dehydrogenase family protein n=1 Tax=Clostridium sp. OS1-26 TaxID=3070681 RepID=UPI0027E05F21|nr:nucleotide sugar dehydrogenase [Clostridium sp. OS1-26]WML35478.1 nucleotide sugar dehydrogenase [Clostridium sp. OS1-26]
MNISVIGLGKLGLCTATCFAVKKHNVIGFDKNDYIINNLKEKKCPIDENDLPELLENSWDKLKISTDIEYVINNSDITLIIVPTPSNPDGRFTNAYVENVFEEIAPYIKKKSSFHIIDVVSTVMPGSSEKIFKPLLEKLTGKTCGKDFGLVYNPEFIALGSVIRNFLNPDMVLIGASDEYSAQQVKNLYEESCESNPYIATMSLTNAEITKISLNCYVTMKISFANELASICEKIPGADVDEITNAIGADTRVGKKYLKGGLGFGGPCFPRDNIAFQAFANEYGAEARLGKQVVNINNDVVERIYNIIVEKVKTGQKIAMLGMSYKVGTHIIEESQSVMIADKLVKNGYKVIIHDPQASESVKDKLGTLVEYSEDVYEAMEGTDAIVFLTNWEEYNKIDWNKVNEIAAENAVIIDSWRTYKEAKFNRLRYVGLGLGN